MIKDAVRYTYLSCLQTSAIFFGFVCLGVCFFLNLLLLLFPVSILEEQLVLKDGFTKDTEAILEAIFEGATHLIK